MRQNHTTGKELVCHHGPRHAMIGDALLPVTQRRAYPIVMPSLRTDWTVEMVRELPDDGNRYEVINGELLVSAAPSLLHQRTLRDLVALLRRL